MHLDESEFNVVLIDMPELGDGEKLESRLEWFEWLRDGFVKALEAALRRNDTGGYTSKARIVFPDEALYGHDSMEAVNPLIVEELTQAGRRFARFHLKTSGLDAEYSFLAYDTCAAMVEGEAFGDSPVEFFAKKFRCMLDVREPEEREGLIRTVYGPDGTTWFHAKEYGDDEDRAPADRLKCPSFIGLAENPSFGKLIDDNVAPYILTRAARGV